MLVNKFYYSFAVISMWNLVLFPSEDFLQQLCFFFNTCNGIIIILIKNCFSWCAEEKGKRRTNKNLCLLLILFIFIAYIILYYLYLNLYIMLIGLWLMKFHSCSIVSAICSWKTCNLSCRLWQHFKMTNVNFIHCCWTVCSLCYN